MKTLQYLLLFFLLSCSKDKKDVEDKPDIDNRDITYKILGITFEVLTGDRELELIENRKSLTYFNNTKSTQKVIINPESIVEKSIFIFERSKDFKISNDSTLYSVPLTIDWGKISLGEEKWSFSDKQIELPTKLVFIDSIDVNPRKKMRIDLSIVYRRIEAKYKMKIQNQVTNEIVPIEGLWKGTYPSRTIILHKEENI